MKKILIIKHGSLGDIILALPAFASIRSHYNKSEILLLTEKRYFNFFDKSPYIYLLFNHISFISSYELELSNLSAHMTK